MFHWFGVFEKTKLPDEHSFILSILNDEWIKFRCGFPFGCRFAVRSNQGPLSTTTATTTTTTATATRASKLVKTNRARRPKKEDAVSSLSSTKLSPSDAMKQQQQQQQNLRSRTQTRRYISDSFQVSQAALGTHLKRIRLQVRLTVLVPIFFFWKQAHSTQHDCQVAEIKDEMT